MCHLCGKITKNGKALNEHLNFVHIKKMSCDLCGKSCPRKRDLMNHIQTHHMKVSFKCTKCPRAFQSQQKLANIRGLTTNRLNVGNAMQPLQRHIISQNTLKCVMKASDGIAVLKHVQVNSHRDVTL